METKSSVRSAKGTDLRKAYVLVGLLAFVLHESGVLWRYRGVIQQTWSFTALQVTLGFSFYRATSIWIDGDLRRELKMPVCLARIGLAIVLGVNLARCLCFSLPGQSIQIHDRLVQVSENHSGRPPHYGSARISGSFAPIEVTNSWARSHSVGDSVVLTASRLPGMATFVTGISSVPPKLR